MGVRNKELGVRGQAVGVEGSDTRDTPRVRMTLLPSCRFPMPLWVQSLGVFRFWVSGFVFRVSGFRVRDSGLGFAGWCNW